MGANFWDTTINATNEEDFKYLFSEEVEQDRFENGNGAYNGSIGQKSTYKLVSETPVSAAECARIKDEWDGGKWDPFAMACPIVQMETFGKTKSFTVTVDVESEWNRELNAEASALKQFGLTDYEIIGNVTIVKVSDATYKVEKDTTFEIGWRVRYSSPKQDSNLFKTKAEAVKAAKEAVANGEHWAQAINNGGVFKRVISKPARYKVSFKYKETRPTDKISHYEVWGWAAY